MSQFVVGLTGGIGSGKSVAAEMFRELGAAVVDTDAIAHELTAAHGAAMPAIRAAFCESVATPDGSLNRAVMRDRVFTDAAARARLEAILHPMIRAQALLRCAAATEPYAVLVVPLLVEVGGAYRQAMSRVVAIDCPEETQLVHVMARGLSREEVARIMAAQSTRVARLAAADDVIDNGGDLADLRRQVEALHNGYLTLAAMSSGS